MAMAFWGVELKPGERYVQRPSRGRLRITMPGLVKEEIKICANVVAILGNCDHSGWSMLESSATNQKMMVILCALNPKSSPMCRLQLEFKEDENVVLSVRGQSSIHLSGYYMHSGNDGHMHSRESPTGKDAECRCLNQKHQENPENTKCRPLQAEETLCAEVMQPQDVRIKGHGDHRCSSARDNHDKEADIGNEKNDMSHHASCNKEEVFEKPIRSEDEDPDDDLPVMVAFRKREAAKTDGAQIHTENTKFKTPRTEKTLNGEIMQQQDLHYDTHDDGNHRDNHGEDNNIGNEKNDIPYSAYCKENEVFEKPIGSEDEDPDDYLPVMVAFKKRRAGKTGGAQIHTEKQNRELPRKKKVLYDQSNFMDQLNGQKGSKVMESKTMAVVSTEVHQITQEGSVVQNTSQEKQAIQNEGHDGLTNQIITKNEPLIKISHEGRQLIVAAEEVLVKKQDDEAKNAKNVKGRVQNRSQKLENGLEIKDVKMGNVGATIASSGDKVCVKYLGWLSTGKVVNRLDFYNFQIGVGEVIRGLEIGISGMRVGGTRRLTIPPLLGYGDKANGEIPANSYLMYEVTLINVKRAEQ